jgi:hypothetical protein
VASKMPCLASSIASRIAPAGAPMRNAAATAGADAAAAGAEAAASGGVPLGGLYHTSGTIKIRLV